MKVRLNKKKILQKFGEFLKKKRKVSKITQLQLAKRIGIHVNAISSIERGISDFSFSIFMKLIIALDICFQEINEMIER